MCFGTVQPLPPGPVCVVNVNGGGSHSDGPENPVVWGDDMSKTSFPMCTSIVFGFVMCTVTSPVVPGNKGVVGVTPAVIVTACVVPTFAEAEPDPVVLK